MMSRRRARESALQALYQCDTLGDWSSECIDLFFATFGNHTSDHDRSNDSALLDDKEHQSHNDQENTEFCHKLLDGVRGKLEQVDRQLASASTHWSVARMARVDRNILRIACYEILFMEDIPVNVSINEAIEIAKLYGGDDSPTFINGVLDKIAKSTAKAATGNGEKAA